MYILEIEPLNEVTKAFYSDWQAKHQGDSGVDLVFPNDIVFENPVFGVLIDLGFKARMIKNNEMDSFTFPWLVMPRSSIYKTPVRQANSVGLIDAGYRGELKAPIDIIGAFKIEQGTRLFQACAPDFSPFQVRVVKQLKDTTTRGANGLGSSGR